MSNVIHCRDYILLYSTIVYILQWRTQGHRATPLKFCHPIFFFWKTGLLWVLCPVFDKNPITKYNAFYWQPYAYISYYIVYAANLLYFSELFYFISTRTIISINYFGEIYIGPKFYTFSRYTRILKTVTHSSCYCII